MKRGAAAVAMAVVLMLLGAACSQVSGSGNVVTRQFDVGSFSKIDVSHSFAMNVSVGNQENVTVRVDDNLVDLLDVGVSGDTLHIGLGSGTSATDATLEADVTVRSLTELLASGSSKVTFADPIQSSTLTLTISGASQLTGPIEIEDGSLELSGASNGTLSGAANTLDVTASGASTLAALELTIIDLTIDASGASNAEVAVARSLSASASGASTVRYAGSPTVERADESDASSIQPVG